MGGDLPPDSRKLTLVFLEAWLLQLSMHIVTEIYANRKSKISGLKINY